MATPASPMSRQEIAALVRQVQGNQLLNRQLSSVCQVNGLKSTGVKAELQRRIVDLIQEIVNAKDVSRFQQVRQSIVNAVTQRSSPFSKNSAARNSLPTMSSTQFASSITALNPGTDSYQLDSYSNTANTNGRAGNNPFADFAHQITFHSSPFYRVDAAVGSMRTCEVMAQHRNSINIPIKMSDHPELQRCINDVSYRVMIFCAGDMVGVQNVAFPHQSELKVNNDEIKANLRGLKNKPGSTRPKFYIVANLCKITPVSELVSSISTRRRIPKESVVAEVNKKAQDPDVVATSQVLSLKCPLSYMRLEVPCRSLCCTHIQCFDATSYLQLQEQGPQWLCPICNKSAPFEQLAVDEYVRDILANTSRDLETVTIEPNGRWSTKAAQDNGEVSFGGAKVEDVDDLEVSQTKPIERRLETPKTQTPLVATPAPSGRESSTCAPRGQASYSAKRPAAKVIDLTLSSDDEESLQRPRKRQNVAANNGYSGPKTTGFSSESPSGYRPS
ncbi:hypothetical protein UVI_02022680 [Ustilaginoidea virens]|uniref:Uncharacterized protein n=1 Tax=Ustilaginoidea virens TaxID=1159556 RepID=A0A1B5L3Y0_USTVR|nr:hypothetical protein UVI_02022680 [Ustilaginoidea virens]